MTILYVLKKYEVLNSSVDRLGWYAQSKKIKINLNYKQR